MESRTLKILVQLNQYELFYEIIYGNLILKFILHFHNLFLLKLSFNLMKFKLIQPYNDYLINILLLLMVSLIYINNNEFKMDFNIYKKRVFN